MRISYTKVEDSRKSFLTEIKSLLASGVDSHGNTMKVSDALTVPNHSVVKRAIEEVIIAPIQPRLVGSLLVDVTYVDVPGKTLTIKTLGALDEFDFSVAEEGEYQEISASKGTASTIEFRFAKYGCKFKISEELLEHSTWDLVAYQIQQVAHAFARYRDKQIMKMIASRGIVVFDNLNPDESRIGRTLGRNMTGAGNGSLTQEDLIDMYAVVMGNGYTPNIILCHPLHWAMFAKDPILRESGILKGDISKWMNSMFNPVNPHKQLPGVLGLPRDIGTEQAALVTDTKPSLPSYSPLSGLTILTSPLVNFDPVTKTADVYMLDTNNTGILAFSELLNLKDWVEERNDLHVIKFREKWDLQVKDNGKAIAIARNISLEPNEMFVNPQVVMDNVVPIRRKG